MSPRAATLGEMVEEVVGPAEKQLIAEADPVVAIVGMTARPVRVIGMEKSQYGLFGLALAVKTAGGTGTSAVKLRLKSTRSYSQLGWPAMVLSGMEIKAG